jgi:hypothetical protein
MKKLFFALPIFISILLPQQALAEEIIPAVISVSSSSDSTEGGQTITVTGANFTSSTQVKIGGVDVEEVFVDSSTITFVSPQMPEGSVYVSASNGMVAAVLNDAYVYVAPPAPAPPAPAPPAPAPPAPVTVSQPVTPSSPEVIQIQPSPTPEPIVEEAVEEVVQQENKAIYLSDNAYVVVDENNTENLVIKTFFDVPQKFVLRQRVDDKWIYVDRSYYFNGNVVFLDTNLELGSTYKVIVEIKDKKTIVAWFTILEQRYVVN